MKIIATYLLLTAVAIVGITACSGEDDNTFTTNYRYDLVTYQGYHGGTAVFQYLGRDDSTALTLQATMPEPTKIKAGQRVLLHYNIDAVPSLYLREITVQYITHANVASDSLRVNTKEISQYSRHPIRLRSLWRTGNYLNLRCEVEFTTSPRALYLMADKATLDSDTIDCYLVHDLLAAADSTYFWRSCYGSFYVGKAWERHSCRAIRVHINDNIYPKVTHYDFYK